MGDGELLNDAIASPESIVLLEESSASQCSRLGYAIHELHPRYDPQVDRKSSRESM